MNASNKWGLELNGSEEAQKAWRTALKPPFDPFIEEVKGERGSYLVLRSSAFDGIATSAEVHRRAEELFRTVNVAVEKTVDTDPLAMGAVIEFVTGGEPRKTHFAKATGTMCFRATAADLILKDAHGNVIEPPPAPSRAQRWMQAAALKPDIGSALRYLEGKPSWFDLYKAYEAIRAMPNGGISNTEIKRFTQTANVSERHHPTGQYKPHKCPMEIWEARALITRWASAAIEDALRETSTDS